MHTSTLLHWLQQNSIGLGLTVLLSAWLWRKHPDLWPSLRLPYLLALPLLLTLHLLEQPALTDIWPLRPPWLQEILIFLGGILLLRLWGLMAFRLLLPMLQWQPPRIIEDIIISFCVLGWGLFRLHQIGVELGQIITTSAVLTAVLAFAMQDTLGNLLAGVAIQLDDSVRLGDWVEVDHIAGRVVEINWRATSLETRNWETVVLPNSLLLKQRFSILGRRRGQPLQWRRWVWFEITLETLPSQIIQLIEKSMREASLPNVASDPPPNCLLFSVENGVARYAVRYWLTDLLLDDPTDSNVRTLIDAALRRNDRRLTSPIFNIFMSKEHEYGDARHKRHTAERMGTLRHLPLFEMLGEDELQTLADQLKFTPFVLGDIMLEQDQISDWLYILVRGQADMFCRKDDGQELMLGKLMGGDFFGEMGLLTNEPSRYGVRAAGNVECYRVSRRVFQEVFIQREELLSSLSSVLATRLQDQQTLLEKYAHHPRQAPQQQSELLASLRAFFSGH